MQVSWIDPDEIAKLAAQLDGPLQREETAAWDLETLPDFTKLFAPEEASVAQGEDLADAIAAPAPDPMDQRGAAPAPELEHIREKLRAIRSRAENAGLLPPKKPSDTGPETEVPAGDFDASPSPAPGPMAPAAIPAPRAPVRIPPAPSPAREPAANPSVTAADSNVQASAFAAPSLPEGGSITDRLQSFMPWARSIAPCEDILLVDDHGDLLWGGSSRADLALSVVLAAGAGLRSGSEALTRSSVFIRSRLGEQKELSVLPCPTRYGMVTLALLNAAGLSNETAAHLREALTQCIDGSALPVPTDDGPQAH